MHQSKKDEEFINPIDPDTITDSPGLIPYPHTIGSPAFAPNQQGAIKKTAIRVMEEQCHTQMDQIREQIALLAKQAEKIKTRMETSKAIYGADMAFEPLAGETYFCMPEKRMLLFYLWLAQKNGDAKFLSNIMWQP